MTTYRIERLNRFVAVYNNVADFPTLADVAAELGVSRKRVKNLAGEIRRMNADGEPGVLKLISRADLASAAETPSKELLPGQKLCEVTGRAVPLSEDERKFRKDWSAEDCILHLRAVVGAVDGAPANGHLHLTITRNAFRNQSDISDSTWNRYFGTFEEFRRQAGLQLSRHAHRLERQIGRHAAHDNMEALSRMKRDYEGRYNRPFSAKQRFRTILVGTDFHGRWCDPFLKRVFLEANRRIQPEVVCFNGDMFDLTEFSRWTQDPRVFDVIGEVRLTHDLFEQVREDNPDAQLDFVEGNHEFRLFRHLAEATPALKTLLHELHGFDIPKLLGLDRFEINFVGRASLKPFREQDIRRELERNWVVYWDSVLGCHYPDRRNLRIPGWGGHHHKHEVWPFFNPVYGACEFHQLGGGHVRAADYTDGEVWHNGFLVVHVDVETRSSVFEYVPVTDFAVLGGKYYFREDSEKLLAR